VAATLTLGAACSSTTTSTSDATTLGNGTSVPAAGGDVTFLAAGGAQEMAAYRELIAAYEKAHPGAHVVLNEAADDKDMVTKLSTAISSGNPPDVFLLDYQDFAQYASKGSIEMVGPRVAASKVFKESDFYPASLDAFRAKAGLGCVPQTASSAIIYVNKKLFADAGVALPEAGWTWAEMVEKAKQLTKDTDGDGKTDQFGFALEAEIINIAPFVLSNGGKIVDDEAKPTKLAFDQPAGEEVIEDIVNLYRVDEVAPGEQEVEAQGIEERFEEGGLAMLLESRNATPGFRSVKDLDFDVAPLPRYEKAASILRSDGYCIASGAKHKDAAWQFVEYAAGPDGAAILARTGRSVPSLTSVATSAAFLDPAAKPAHAQVWLDNIDSMARVPQVSTWPELERKTESILEEAQFESGNASEVAEELTEQTKDIFARGTQP
jgi:multiple sugar transport system substrate-binding protein